MRAADHRGSDGAARTLATGWIVATIVGLLLLGARVPLAWSQGDVWSPLPPVTLEGRYLATAVWTGTEVIVWGGNGTASALNDGARYNPATGTWTAVQTSGAPSARAGHTAVWTGSEMIIWGGGPALADGARYNPTTDTWTPTSAAPIGGRNDHSAVWTGTEMIVWGGVANGVTFLSDGARYNSATDTWTVIASPGAPGLRSSHVAVWTGTDMLVWGGGNAGVSLNDGGRYNPASDTWAALAPVGLAAGAAPTSVWTGTEMIVWGGCCPAQGDGARYNPATDAWTLLSVGGAPAARFAHRAVWTGSEMIVWGGIDASLLVFGDGARYDPSADTWTALPTAGAPSPRYFHSSVWTGGEMVVWGGITPSGCPCFDDGASYTPPESATPFTAFLHGSGGTANPPTLFLDTSAPTAATAKYKDSPSIKLAGGNAWKAVGTWHGEPAFASGTLSALTAFRGWLGLKNSDDQGTNFDLRVEVLKNGSLVATGEAFCIDDVTRNPAQAKLVTVPFDTFAPTPFNGTSDVLSLAVFTRIGTDGAGTFCGGHSNAVGLRVYFDSPSRDSGFDGEFGP